MPKKPVKKEVKKKGGKKPMGGGMPPMGGGSAY